MFIPKSGKLKSKKHNKDTVYKDFFKWLYFC